MGKDSNEIRREIEATRARMGDTVEALGYKADVPARVKDAVNDRVETVKGTIGDAVGSVKDAVGGVAGKVGTALGGAQSTVSNTLSETSGRVGEMTQSVTEQVSGMTGSVSEKVSGVTGSVSEKVSGVTQAARRGVGIAVENPLGLALGALAVGFLAGLVAPVTGIEREKVGPIRDGLLDKAQEIGGDVLEHGKQVLQETAQATVEAAQRSAQAHGGQVLGEALGERAHGESGGDADGEVGSRGQSVVEYGALLEEDQLKPGAPGTASP